jgi:hypothetical protein
MAKINITVDLEWLGEDGSLDDMLKEEIASKVVNMTSEKSAKSINDKINARIAEITKNLEGTIGAKLTEYMEEFFTSPRDITDRWGDVKSRGSIKDLLLKACDEFMSENVDSDGRVSAYGSSKSRTQYMVNKICGDIFEKKVSAATESALKTATEKLDSIVKAQLGERLAKLAGLDVK